MADPRWENSRKIVKRIQVEGDLVLETPVHLGNGDAARTVDMPLLVDALSGEALLTGASLAGALRNHLRERQHGHRMKEERDDLAEVLFGDRDDGDQSLLIVSDARGGMPAVELRDGVAIDSRTRTAVDKKKYDLELLQAGTKFEVRLELLVPENQEKPLCQALATALVGLEEGEIGLGMRKRRGFGKCKVEQWWVRSFDLTQPAELMAWLGGGRVKVSQGAKAGSNIAELLNAEPVVDMRSRLTLDATFRLAGSLLIRSGGDDPGAPDMVHLKSMRKGQAAPVVSGTSLAGALRARGLRIAKTVGRAALAAAFVDCLFGQQIESAVDRPTAGRLWVEETEILKPIERVVNRVKIDRFTGGSYPGALFNQQPIFGGEETRVRVRLRVESPSDAEIGLVLLLLKDLWTGDLPIGGEANVGRGRLDGLCADLSLRRKIERPEGNGMIDAIEEWACSLRQVEDRLVIPAQAELLQSYVNRFVEEVQDGTASD